MDYRAETVKNHRKLNRKRKIRLWWFRISMVACVFIVLFLFYSFYFNQSLFPNFIARNIEKISYRFNYLVKDIEIVGDNDNCQIADISLLEKYKGVPTLLVSVDNIRSDLESVDCVGKVSVSRLMPSKLKIYIEPRVPIAIWQHNHKFFFIDNQGVVIEIRNSKDVKKFIIIVGEDAPKMTPELLKMLSTDQELYAKIVSAVWVGGRRWNIIFDNGTELLLPEESYIKAWNKFVELSKSNEAFKNLSYRVIDLRIKNRIYAK